MLIKCPECMLNISDKAEFCPHCGMPMQKKKRACGKKRMRLPNGFGQISEIKGRRLRNPFRAMVTVGKDENGRPICKPLKPRAYFATYNDAYAALVEYNRAPYDLEAELTVKELYDMWFAEYERSISSKTSISQTKAAWEYCSEIYDMRVRDVRPRHIKKCIDEGKAMFRGKERIATPLLKSRIKTLFNLMFDYAVEYELADMNHARSFRLPEDLVREIKTVKRGHMIYTDDEMERLWEYSSNTFVGMVIVQCYSGWRPQELLTLKMSDVDIENRTFRGGMKTDAGKNRVVPIHSRIWELILRNYRLSAERGCIYLFGHLINTEKPISYMQFLRSFDTAADNIGIGSGHRLHDGRTHFVTSAKRFGVDEYAIKYIVGHKISDITEAVYTKRDPDWLRREIEKIM